MEYLNKIIEEKDYTNDCYNLEFTYLETSKFFLNKEHSEIHEVDNIQEYVYNIPPVLLEDIGIGMIAYAQDGQHRYNTFNVLGLKAPVIILRKKEGHKQRIHKRIRGVTYSICICKKDDN
jgi:hypothetical protein